MAQIKKDTYIVVFAYENATNGEWGQEVFSFDDSAEGTAMDLAKAKYHDVLRTYWNDSTYDYIAVNLIRISTNFCIEGDFRDCRVEPEMVNP